MRKHLSPLSLLFIRFIRAAAQVRGMVERRSAVISLDGAAAGGVSLRIETRRPAVDGSGDIEWRCEGNPWRQLAVDVRGGGKERAMTELSVVEHVLALWLLWRIYRRSRAKTRAFEQAEVVKLS